MKRLLRHPINSIREPFGTAGLIVAMIALVAALGGTALAARGALSGPEKHLIKKEAKKWGKKFAKQGPAGAPGAAGTNGTNGKDGAAGTAGANGANGADGKNVAVSGTAPGCTAGGITVQVAGEPATAKEVCNGEEGEPGEEGSPWTDGGTLPTTATETGVWGGNATEGTNFYPVSFPIPLATPPTLVVVKAGEDKSAEGCAGEVNEEGHLVGGKPVAASGKLCVYMSVAELFSGLFTITATDPTASGGAGVSTSGTLLEVQSPAEFPIHGVWAVSGD